MIDKKNFEREYNHNVSILLYVLKIIYIYLHNVISVREI